jgi:NTE family protein
MMANRPRIGLALGAGGTKGTAHIGVLKVLQEANIPIDLIAGASIGAAYGASYAAGRAPARMERDALATPARDVISFFTHRLKLAPTNPIGEAFHDVLQGLTFADLSVPFAAVASDLFRRGPVVLQEGSVLRAVEASIAVPLMAAPVKWGDRYLLDGGFWEQTPVGVAASMGADKVIDVVLGEPIVLPHRAWPLVRRLIRALDGPARRCGPGTLASAVFLLFTLIYLPSPGRKADVSIRPDVVDISANSPFHTAVCLRRGEEAAKAALPQIEALLG